MIDSSYVNSLKLGDEETITIDMDTGTGRESSSTSKRYGSEK